MTGVATVLEDWASVYDWKPYFGDGEEQSLRSFGPHLSNDTLLVVSHDVWMKTLSFGLQQ